MDAKSFNLIVIDDSFDTEEKVVSTLRVSGYSTKSSRVEDEEDLLEAIKERSPDIILYSQGMELISLKETCDLVRGMPEIEQVPVIAVDKVLAESSIVDAINAGAADLSSYENIEHLKQVIKREVTAYRNWKQISALEKALNDTEKRVDSLLDSSRDAIAYVHEGMHVYSNDSYIELFGYESSEDVEVLPILDMVAPMRRDEFKDFLRSYMTGEEDTKSLHTRLIKPDGAEFDGEMEFSPANIEGEPCTQVVIRLEANTEELEQQIEMISRQDNLTGLYNRQYFMESLNATVSDCNEGKYIAAMMEIQIDSFDDINEKLGIADTDKFISEVANLIKENINDKDSAYRYMHSTFTIISLGLDAKGIEAHGKEIQKAMEDRVITIDDESINTTFSIGAVLIDKNSPDANELLSRAEKALDEATDKGTNQLSIYVPKKGELTSKETDELFKKQITDALRFNKFETHYQPIVSLQGDTDHRYEVFVRLNQESKDQLVMPNDFMHTAERIGMATAIDRWVLNTTIKVLKERWDKGEKIRFFIKLSAPSIQDSSLITWLKQQIKEKELPPKTLFFEVKESVAVTNLKQTAALSKSLQIIKCGLVLDDFGAGKNPFQILEHIDVDFVRLGSQFMNDINESTENQEAVQQIGVKISEMGKMTIAQHVQDVTSLSLLFGMGVQFVQGYVLQEPMPHLEYDFSEMSG